MQSELQYAEILEDHTCPSSKVAQNWRYCSSNRRVRHPKFFFLQGVDWCVTTVNSSLTHRRVPKALLSFFCPTKPPIDELTNHCMTSMQDSSSAPHQIKFDTDSQKFLIDSGASAHLWNRRKDFIYYRSLCPQERKNDQVLGVSREAVSPQGIGSIRLRIEDDLNDIHTIHLHDIQYLPEAPINIFVPFPKCSPNNAKPRETLRQVAPSLPTPSPSSGPAKMANKPTNMFP